VVLPDSFLEDLTQIVGDFAEAIEEDKSLYKIMERLAGMMYHTTGNGYFLSLKGIKLY
jgi:hypothetical protein